MREFSSFGGFAAFLESRTFALREAETRGLERAAQIVEEEAKAEIGDYRPEADPFAAWAPLSDATLNGGVSPSGHRYPGKIELGFAPPDNPLLRSGELRDAIEHSVAGRSAAVGVPSKTVTAADGRSVDIGDVAIWQELGTVNMPARSFLGGALVRKSDEVVNVVAGEVFKTLAGGSDR